MLCSKRYNEITYPATHNAQSNQRNWLLYLVPRSNINNQTKDILGQLQGGIRAFKMPIHLSHDQATVCHGMGSNSRTKVEELVCNRISFLEESCKKFLQEINPCFIDPAAASLTHALSVYRKFLDQNPNEIVTLFLEDFSGHMDLISKSLHESGLDDYLHYQNPLAPWPRLKEMIQTNKRLVGFINRQTDLQGRDIASLKVLNSTAYYTKSSTYDFRTVEDIDQDAPTVSDLTWSEKNRTEKSPHNKLFILQHFVTPALAGSPTAAAFANQASLLSRRVSRYQQQLKMKPNFIWVDFFELPERESGVFDVVNKLNEEL